MTELSKGSQAISLVTALLSAIAVLGVGYLTYRSNTEGTDLKRQEIALAQNRFDAEERRRFEENIAKIVPLLFDKEQQDAALATLFALYPDRAQEVLSSFPTRGASTGGTGTAATRGTATGGKGTVIESAVERAAALPQHVANWVIVSASDRTVAAAKPEVEKANRLGYSTTMYRRGDWYATTLGPFPSRADADRANIAVRQTIRPDAYVVNVERWCPSQQRAADVIECNAK